MAPRAGLICLAALLKIYIYVCIVCLCRAARVPFQHRASALFLPWNKSLAAGSSRAPCPVRTRRLLQLPSGSCHPPPEGTCRHWRCRDVRRYPAPQHSIPRSPWKPKMPAALPSCRLWWRSAMPGGSQWRAGGTGEHRAVPARLELCIFMEKLHFGLLLRPV